MKTVFVKLKGRYRDGGTELFVDKNGKSYWKDGRIGTPTRGAIYGKDFSNEVNEILDVNLIEIPANQPFPNDV